MNYFLKENVAVEHLNIPVDGKHFRLLAPFDYHEECSGQTITPEEGFLTDFASIPWWGRWLIDRTGRHGKAAVLHDWLYKHPNWRSREQCDQAFLDAMVLLGVNKRKRELMYWAVRKAGGATWSKYRRARCV